MASSPGLDRALPRYDVVERHSRLIRAVPAATDAAFRALTLREMSAVAVLFALRSLPERLAGRTAGLPAVSRQPLLEQFVASGFAVLHDGPGEEIVLGVIAQMWRPGGQVVPLDGLADFTAFARPGFAKAALSFTFSAEGRATRAATETRVQATDDAARRAFGRYWLVVGPFSGLIRRRWLAAIAARAEAQK